jgi:AraC-like DNA-binding protein
MDSSFVAARDSAAVYAIDDGPLASEDDRAAVRRMWTEPHHPRHETRARSTLIVRRAEAFFRDHIGETISIAQLSSVAGVSERGLRNAFYDVYAISPKRYLRRWQLHQVRRALRAPSRLGVSVTDVAMLHGFYELGRFAGEYKALFGERPSQTLRRARAAGRQPACLTPRLRAAGTS